MANLYVSYFKQLAKDQQGNVVPVGQLPSAGGQVVAFTTATDSDAVPKGVRFVRLLADADAYLGIGSPATANSGLKLEANVAEYFGIDGDGSTVISVYDGTS